MGSIRDLRPGSMTGRSLIGVACLTLLVASGPAVPESLAGPDESTDVAAFFLHASGGVGEAQGPLSTQFAIFNSGPLSKTVNVTCFNFDGSRGGPVGGLDVSIGPFAVAFHTPASLNLADLAVGWCYFFTKSGKGNIAVEFAIGFNGADPGANGLSNIFLSNASRSIGVSSAQAWVSNDDASVPMWFGGKWSSFLVLLNPTVVTAGVLTVDVYDTGGTLLCTLGGTAADTFPARVLRAFVLSDCGGNLGAADIDVQGKSPDGAALRGFQGWLLGFNHVSFELILSSVPLDRNDSSPLGEVDRP